MGSFFIGLQKVGQAFMLPVAVLPVAGIMLGVGASDLPFIPSAISLIMKAAGDSIFGVMPLLFAIATAIGFSKQDGAAGLAALVGFVVYLGTMGAVTILMGGEVKPVFGIQSVDTGVLGGILVGFLTAFCYNRYNNIKLPEWLGFFGGRRFVPIVTACGSLFLGAIMAFIWGPVGGVIESFSHWAAYQSPTTAFSIYATVERLLVPTGLHHIWNVPFFFEVGTYTDPITGNVLHGEISRYLAGDKTAGYLVGSYLYKMYGLPAAALAMIHCAKPENKKAVASIMISAAITSFLTGITEPIEFSFLFVAPILYGVHVLLAGVAYLIVIPLGIRHGTTFSHGLIDYLVLYSKSTNGWMLVPLGLIWGVVYYSIFRFIIQVFNLKTPGREDILDSNELANNKSSSNSKPSDNTEIGKKLVIAYGGSDNIIDLDSCISRLRISVKDPKKVDQEELKRLGAKGFVTIGKGVQSIFGPLSDSLREQMKEYIDEQKK